MRITIKKSSSKDDKGGELKTINTFYYYLGETDLLWSPLHCIIDNVDAYKCLVNQHLVLLILVDIADR